MREYIKDLVVDEKAIAISKKFVIEREKIRIRKERGDPPPWTDWEPLQNYRFTNVRHLHDRVTQWLLNNWYLPNRDHPNLLVAAATARLINYPDSLEEIGFPDSLDGYADRVERVLLDRQDKGKKVINNAYLIRGFEGVRKATSIAHRWIGPFAEDFPKIDSSQMKTMHSMIAGNYAGLGSFIAGQMVVDIQYVYPGPWRDRYDWAPQGPGSTRFMSALYGERPRPNKRGRLKFTKSMNAEEFQRRFMKFREVLLADQAIAQQALDLDMLAHDFQNLACESYKLWRYYELGQRPKNSYGKDDSRRKK